MVTHGSSQAARSWIAEEEAEPPRQDAAPEAQPDVDELYRAHAARLTGYLTRRTGSREEALDVVQEAFSRLLRLGRARSADIMRPEAYLKRIAQNLIRNSAKSRARRSDHLHIVAEDAPLVGPDQHRLLETRDMLRRVEAAMLKLKPKTREIFVAHRLDGMSYAEIAERTGLSVKGVEKQMSKAIAHIDRMLDRT